MARLLLVEDDLMIVQTLQAFLKIEGYDVRATDGQAGALRAMEDAAFDLLLVDVSLADGSGFAVCAAATGRGLPVIFLTAATDEYSVVTGLELGAYDYIAKPFRPKELVARIENALRRARQGTRLITLGSIVIDPERSSVRKDGNELYLSALEYRLLLILATNRGRVFSRAQLLEKIWDCSGDFVNDNTLTVYIKRLREKIEDDPAAPRIVKTVRKLGYWIE